MPTAWLLNVSLVGDKVTAADPLEPPVPARLTVCGLPLALSVMLIEPNRDPAAVGVKVTLIVQLELAASEPGQLLV